MQPLPTEIVILGASVILLLVQLFMQAILSTLERGGEYNAGPRDQPVPITGKFAGRAERAFRNLLETYPVFVALALALTVTGRNGGYGALGAQVWLTMRVLFVPLYLFPIPFLRSMVWFASIFGLVAMLIRLFE